VASLRAFMSPPVSVWHRRHPNQPAVNWSRTFAGNTRRFCIIASCGGLAAGENVLPQLLEPTAGLGDVFFYAEPEIMPS
jgi:hypothetical protein